MPYYHVIAKINAENKYQCLFADLSVGDLKKNFIRPYERGKSFFSGNDLFSSLDLRSVQIIRTEHPDKLERDEINRKDREQIDEINRRGELVIFSFGGGYEPEDIARAGEDLTHSFIKGPPGFKANKFVPSVKAFGWIAGVISAVIIAGLIKWLGWK